MLEGLGNMLIEQSLCFKFNASNSQAEYEALIVGIKLPKEMRATNLHVRNNS